MAASDEDILRPELVNDTAMWRLVLCVDGASLQAAIIPATGIGAAVYKKIPLKGDDDTTLLNSLKEAMYDNPLLVQGGWNEIICLCDTYQWMLMPQGVDPWSIKYLYSDDDIRNVQMMCDQVGDAALTWLMPEAFMAFLTRTLTTPRFMHRSTPLIHHARLQGPGVANIWAYVTADTIDIISHVDGKLQLANSYALHHSDDAVYYIMAVSQTIPDRQRASLSVTLTGRPEHRNAIIPQLRQLLDNVAVEPPIYNASDIPLPLILAPTCV